MMKLLFLASILAMAARAQGMLSLRCGPLLSFRVACVTLYLTVRPMMV